MKIDKIAIIGAAGQMGKWFASFFSDEGSEVFAYDRNKKGLLGLKRKKRINLAKRSRDAVKSADFILISVLNKDLKAVLKEIAPQIRENQIVIDITSLKEKPVRLMHKFLKRNLILGVHPLFGPSAKPRGQNFILTPTNKREKNFARAFKIWLEKTGFNVAVMSPKKHDELMSVVLGLPHFIGLTAGSTLAKLDTRELKAVAGPSFKKLLDLVESVIFSSPELYSELHLNLPKINKIENYFEKEIRLWRKIIKNENQEEFIKKMAKTKNAISK